MIGSADDNDADDVCMMINPLGCIYSMPAVFHVLCVRYKFPCQSQRCGAVQCMWQTDGRKMKSREVRDIYVRMWLFLIASFDSKQIW